MFLLDTTKKQLIYLILSIRKKYNLEHKEAYEYHYYKVKNLEKELIEVLKSTVPKESEEKIIYSIYSVY
tara:strand:+ start:841 stop:1047 length:207 start_codon:yes stop_codon:yes gene_type:complete